MIKKELLDRTYILTGREIFEFIENNTCFDPLDMQGWFSEWLKDQKFFPSEEEITNSDGRPLNSDGYYG